VVASSDPKSVRIDILKKKNTTKKIHTARKKARGPQVLTKGVRNLVLMGDIRKVAQGHFTRGRRNIERGKIRNRTAPCGRATVGTPLSQIIAAGGTPL